MILIEIILTNCLIVASSTGTDLFPSITRVPHSSCSILIFSENQNLLAGLSIYNSSFYSERVLLTSQYIVPLLDVASGTVELKSCSIYLRDGHSSGFYVSGVLTAYNISVSKQGQNGIIGSFLEGAGGEWRRRTGKVKDSEVRILSSYLSGIVVGSGRRKTKRLVMGERIAVEGCLFSNVSECEIGEIENTRRREGGIEKRIEGKEYWNMKNTLMKDCYGDVYSQIVSGTEETRERVGYVRTAPLLIAVEWRKERRIEG